ASSAATGGRDHRHVAYGTDWRITHARAVRIFDFAVFDFLHAGEALLHHLHVRGNNRFAEPAKFLLVLMFDRREKGFIADAVVLQEGRYAKESATASAMKPFSR